jgi:hypothetical protein
MTANAGECFPQADAIGEDAAVVGLQFVNNARGCIALEVEELFPYKTVFITGAVIGQDIGSDVFKNSLKML